MHRTTPELLGLLQDVDSSGPAKVTALPGRSDQDRGLMARIVESGDRQAFNQLVVHYGPRLKSWLLHRGEGDANAEDIVQDVMVSVWQKAAQFDPDRATFSTWVFRMTRNRWIDHKRKHDRVQPMPPEDMAVLADEPVDSPHETLMQSQSDAAVREAIAELPPEQKQMLQLAFFEGLSHSEIAARTGIAIGTVKSRIRAPLKKLQSVLYAHRKVEG